MALKDGMTALSSTGLCTNEQLSTLRGRSITTAEELVGAIDAEPAAMANLLNVSESEVRRLRNRAFDRLSQDARSKLEHPPRQRRFRLGAFPPKDR